MKEFFQDALLGLALVFFLIAVCIAPHWVQVLVLVGALMMVASLIGDD